MKDFITGEEIEKYYEGIWNGTINPKQVAEELNQRHKAEFEKVARESFSSGLDKSFEEWYNEYGSDED